MKNNKTKTIKAVKKTAHSKEYDDLLKGIVDIINSSYQNMIRQYLEVFGSANAKEIGKILDMTAAQAKKFLDKKVTEGLLECKENKYFIAKRKKR